LWNAKNGEKNPDNVPERRAHRVTHQARGGGGSSGSAGPTVRAAYSVIYPHRTLTTLCACPWNRPVRTAARRYFGGQLLATLRRSRRRAVVLIPPQTRRSRKLWCETPKYL